MKKIGSFLKKHKKIIIIVLVLIIVVAAIAIGLDLRVKHQWKKHPVEPYSYEFQDNGDMETMRQRILATKYNSELDVDGILKDVKPDGSFKSIDYKSERKDFWPPLDHLKNTLDLQIAYYSKGNPHYNDPAVKEAVTKAMNHWSEKNYQCSWNWWYNVVGVGKYVPDILLFGVEGLSKESEDRLLKNIEGTLLQNEQVFYGAPSREVDSSGGNLTDQVLSTMKVAILENDGSTMMWLTNLLDRELKPFPDYEPRAINQIFRADCVGIKSDGSFQQHDQLVYFGGYGEVFVDGMNKYLAFTKDTQYALNNAAVNRYADFILDSMQYLTRGGYRDISASGRGISRPDALKGIAPQTKEAARVLLTYGNAVKRSTELQNMLETRFTGKVDAGAKGHRYFYESDLQVINNKNYMATVRAASPRTRIYEFLNGENPKAYYTGMGATFFYVHGNEYYNILPMYDWNKIPGTTTKQGEVPYYDEGFSYNTYGDNNSVNGVSNGTEGMSYLKVNDHGVTGNKAYFMFDNAVVCLGNSLQTDSGKILTNINQANLVGDVVLGGKKDVNLKVGSEKTGKYSFVYHNNIAYFTDSEVEVSLEHLKGDWKDLNERDEKSNVIEGDKFTLSIPHKEKDASYAYTVLLNTDLESAKAYEAAPRYKVISNTAVCQAVLDTKTNILQVVFHEKGELEYGEGKKITTNKPCVMIVENVKGEDKVTVASYDYKGYKAKITVNAIEFKGEITKKPQTIK